MTPPGKFGVGFIVGALLAVVISVAWTPGGDVTETTPVAVTVTEPMVEVAPWLEVGEVFVDSAFILPRDLIVEDGRAILDYDLAGLSSSLFESEDADYQGEIVVKPEHWVLTTRSGATVEASSGPRSSSVWFQLPSEDDEVAAINLVGWRVGTPLGGRVELPIEVGAVGSFRSGVVTIATVLEQTVSTIVQIDFDEVDDNWQFGIVRPVDRTWRVSGRSGGGVQLIWDGEDAPDRLVLEDVGLEMRAVTGDIPVIDQRDDL